MNILMGIQRLWRGGGTETHVMTLSRCLKNLGHQVTLYTSGGEWVTKARSMGLRVHVEPHWHPSKKSTSHVRFRQFLMQNHFDVLHAHDGPSLDHFTSAITGLSKKPKLIFTVHGPYVGKRILLKAQHRASAMIAVSSEIAKSLPAAVNRNKVFIVSNGISAESFSSGPVRTLRLLHGINSKSFVVGYSGRFTFDKILLGKRVTQALSDYAVMHPGVEVLIAGRGSRAVVRARSRVHVLGHIEDMNAFYRSCDVVLCTGRTAAEATLCGVPVIAIGKAGYQGIVTWANVDRMLRSNFGDHGLFKQPWSTRMISRDVKAIQTAKNHFRLQAMMARRYAESKLSAKRMASRTQQVYQRA